jgi:hypothetical protein
MSASPHRNRVTPTGEIVAIPLRGCWLGNRGILHEGFEVRRNHTHKRWITCVLSHKDWRLPQWRPGRFTVLFFHDEAVSLAAGHRPCALCRRPDYDAFRAAWVESKGGDRPGADAMDVALHRERMVPHTRRRRFHRASWSEPLPDGTFVLVDDGPAVVLGDAVVPWSTSGYGRPRTRPRSGDVVLVTPPTIVGVLGGGYRPQVAAEATAS